ncbi:hypothetical protein O9993_05510 [Vibrio lentus]|nr:hypothetical protein [Vibrio lentus]
MTSTIELVPVLIDVPQRMITIHGGASFDVIQCGFGQSSFRPSINCRW